MKATHALLLPVTSALAAAILCAAPARALDPPTANDSYQVIHEDDRVRIVDVVVAPGTKVPMHSHPRYLVYALTPGRVRMTSPDGTSAEMTLRAGDSQWRDPESHAVENLGTAPVRVLHVELKAAAPSTGGTAQAHSLYRPDSLPWKEGPAKLPPGAKMAVLDGDPSKAGPFTMRLRLPAGYRVPAHTHPADEHVTVVSGTFHLGRGDRFDATSGEKLGPGGFVVIPAGLRHYAWTSAETELQLHGTGPWSVDFLDPANEPTRMTAPPAR